MSQIRNVDSQGRIVEPAAVDEKPTTQSLVDRADVADNARSTMVGGEPLQASLVKAVEQVMGLDNDSERNRYAQKVNTLLEWAKTQTKDHTPENIMWAIRSLELKTGTPPLAEKRINYIARMAYLLMEGKKIETEIKSLSGS